MATPVSDLKAYEKLWVAMDIGVHSPRVISRLSAEALAMLHPENLLLFAAMVAIWALGTAWGGPVAAAVDGALLVLAVFSWGKDLFKGGTDIYKFGQGALSAETEQDLQLAGEHFADVLVDIGSAAIMALFSSTAFRAARVYLVPRIKVRIPEGWKFGERKVGSKPREDVKKEPTLGEKIKETGKDLVRGAGGQEGAELVKNGISPAWLLLPLGLGGAGLVLYLLSRKSSNEVTLRVTG